MSGSPYLKYYWQLLNQLRTAVCVECKGVGCEKCHKTGKKPLVIQVNDEWYKIPIWALDKNSAHEFLKNTTETFPKQPNGKPYSMSPNQPNPPPIYNILQYFEELELLARYSGIKLDIAEDLRNG